MENQNQPKKRTTELLSLNRFAGTWNTNGNLIASPGQAPLPFYGTDTYKWLPGGFFMLHEVDVLMNGVKMQSVEIIGYDSQSKSYPTHFYDNQGESGTMHAHFEGDHWTILSPEQRFSGKFSEDDNVLSGIWEQLIDNTWRHWMDIRLSRQE